MVPAEGALLWTDAMVIPRGAAHLADAITYMDHVYDPKVAAQMVASRILWKSTGRTEGVVPFQPS